MQDRHGKKGGRQDPDCVAGHPAPDPEEHDNRQRAGERDEPARDEQVVRARQRGIERQRAADRGGRGVQRGERVEGQGRPVKEVGIEIAAENGQRVRDGGLFIRPGPQVARSPNQIGNSRRMAASNTIATSAGGFVLLPITATRAHAGRSSAQVTRQKRNAPLSPERVLSGKDLLLDLVRPPKIW